MMVTGLSAAREQTRSFLYKKKLRNFRVTSGEKLLDWEEGATGSQLSQLWGRDPVHLSSAGYKTMALKIVSMATDPQPFIHGTGSGRDATLSRSSWVQQDDATASRSAGQQARQQLTSKRGRGRGRWRPYQRN